MGTPLYNTDIIPLTSRPTLAVMDDGDYFVILDTSTGKISKILRTNIQKALNISYDNTTSELTAESVQAALDELVVNLGSSDSAISALAGRLYTLEGTGEGSVAKAIDDAVSPIAEVVDTNRLYSDSQYLELKAKADSLQVKCNTLEAEVYTDDPILQYGATEIIGDGYEADDTPIDVSANVVDGKLDIEQKGLTIRNLSVEGQTFQTTTYAKDRGTYHLENGHKYYVSVTRHLVSGTDNSVANGRVIFLAPNFMLLPVLSGSWTRQNVVTFSGVTGDYILTFYGTIDGIVNWNNFMFVDLTSLGLDHITDTAILAKLLPYVDGTKNVGKMGMRVVGRNLFDKNTGTYNGYRINESTGALIQVSTTTTSGDSYSAYIPVLPSTAYKLGGQVLGLYTPYAWYDKNKVYISGGSTKNPSFTSPSNAQYVRISLFASEKNIIQLNLGSTALPYEPYQEQLTFLPAIGNSLPNGIADSIKTVVDGWEYTKRVYPPEAVGSGVAVNTTNYPTAKNGGQWVNELTAGGTEIGVVGTDSTTGAGMLRFELAIPTVTYYDLPHLTSGKTIHRFAGEEKIALYGTGLTFSENVLTVLSAIKFVAGVMTDITALANITTNTVTFSGVNATDVVYVKVEHDVDRPLGILEHTPAVSNTASRLLAIENWIAAQEEI